jgi:hypothetical protein
VPHGSGRRCVGLAHCAWLRQVDEQVGQIAVGHCLIRPGQPVVVLEQVEAAFVQRGTKPVNGCLPITV